MTRSHLRKAYDRIRGGMTLAEVEALLGGPGVQECPSLFPRPRVEGGHPEWFWTDGEVAIGVIFNRKTGEAEAWERAERRPPGTTSTGFGW
jgi:hypothetical protein